MTDTQKHALGLAERWMIALGGMVVVGAGGYFCQYMISQQNDQQATQELILQNQRVISSQVADVRTTLAGIPALETRVTRLEDRVNANTKVLDGRSR